MFKLINLIIIFVSLQFIIPNFKSINVLTTILSNVHVYNVFTALVIGIIQLLYSYIPMLYNKLTNSNKKNTSFKNRSFNSLFIASVVLCGLYLINDIPDISTGINMPGLSELQTKIQNNNLFKSSFITLLITFFIIIKFLLTP